MTINLVEPFTFLCPWEKNIDKNQKKMYQQNLRAPAREKTTLFKMNSLYYRCACDLFVVYVCDLEELTGTGV